ncbi:hypothetical protein THAOC_14953 [Thalassiosira oceanica]|uniref:Uncharacterized protein n=1 Tax=Thalassiosira oceanica TaxID=159749 RepID=K0STI4_THAOC|nr:hypothetical protein THAOC_14953 [Thalassiosira oceanica]|eukprot:EJK64326.1 hypothetical protein THAOC_14953 [Thalassiosira oceanica]
MSGGETGKGWAAKGHSCTHVGGVTLAFPSARNTTTSGRGPGPAVGFQPAISLLILIEALASQSLHTASHHVTWRASRFSMFVAAQHLCLDINLTLCCALAYSTSAGDNGPHDSNTIRNSFLPGFPENNSTRTNGAHYQIMCESHAEGETPEHQTPPQISHQSTPSLLHLKYG